MEAKLNIPKIAYDGDIPMYAELDISVLLASCDLSETHFSLMGTIT